MVRDSYVQTPKYTYHDDAYWPDGSVRWKWTWSRSHRTHRSWRGNLVHSNGVLPTPYRAYSYKNLVHSCDLVSNDGLRKLHGPVGDTLLERFHLEGKPWDVYFPNRLENGAMQRAMDSARSANSVPNLGQTFGELPETLDFIYSNAVTVLKAYREVRARKFGAAVATLGLSRETLRTLPKKVSSAWLSLQLGWKPLLNDIYEISQLSSSDFRPKGFYTVRDIKKENTFITFDFSPREGSHTKGCEIGISYSVVNPWWANLNALGLLNPIAVAWELVPLSFVVDWFLPIGQVFQAASQDIGLEFHHGYKTRFSNGSFTYWRPIDGFSGEHPKYSVTVSGMDRTPLYDFPIPKLAIPPVLNPSKAFTLLALMNR